MIRSRENLSRSNSGIEINGLVYRNAWSKSIWNSSCSNFKRGCSTNLLQKGRIPETSWYIKMKHASNKVSTQVQIQGETMRKLKKLLMKTPEDIYKKKKEKNTKHSI
jgi:hypothetical protein